jgi:hypothetical protein
VRPTAADSAASGELQPSEETHELKEACTQENQEVPKGKAECRARVAEETITEEDAEGKGEDHVSGRSVGDATGCAREESQGNDGRENGGGDVSGAVSGEEEDIGEDACAAQKPSGLSEQEELREEAGCVLWDLAANESQAEFLVISWPKP